MQPVHRKDHNHVYKAPPGTEGEIGDLHCRVEGAITYSHWVPSQEELQTLQEGGHIELHIIGHPHPPVGIDVTEALPPPKEEPDGNP